MKNSTDELSIDTLRMLSFDSEQDATGKAKQIYREIEQSFGMVPNFFKAQAAVDPEWLEINWQREKKIMLDQGALDRKTKELLAMAVSLVNGCEYCSLANAGGLPCPVSAA